MSCIGPKQLTVVSGKGGTGKTTILGSFAALAENVVLADCDVDAANLHLLLHPKIRETFDFHGAKIAVRNDSKCRSCGAAEVRCRFDAVTVEGIDAMACEGCGLCTLVCPASALSLEKVKSGEYFRSETRYGPMVHARLLPGGESSGKLVTAVRRQAESIAAQGTREMVLIDGPPGIGCTATAALAEVDLALIVTEPTLSGIHDLQRVVQLAEHFRLPSAVIINKADINPVNTLGIHEYCHARGISLLGEVPFDDEVTVAIASGRPLVEHSVGAAASAVRQAWERTKDLLKCTATN